MVDVLTDARLKRAIRDGYAWPGGYAIVGITSDGECLCARCMRSEYPQIHAARRWQLSDGWRVVGLALVGADLEPDAGETCAHCGRALEDL